jgi:putative tricarboxylic transport membrane protein
LGRHHRAGPGLLRDLVGVEAQARHHQRSRLIVAAVTEGGPTLASRWQGARWTKPALVIACLIAFSFALEPAGFLLSAIPLMLLLLRVIDPVRWSLAIPVAVLVPLGMWWVLKRLLLIQLPSGLFGIG